MNENALTAQTEIGASTLSDAPDQQVCADTEKERNRVSARFLSAINSFPRNKRAIEIPEAFAPSHMAAQQP